MRLDPERLEYIHGLVSSTEDSTHLAKQLAKEWLDVSDRILARIDFTLIETYEDLKKFWYQKENVDLLRNIDSKNLPNHMLDDFLRKLSIAIKSKQVLSIDLNSYEVNNLSDDIINKILKENEVVVKEYLSGKKEAINFLVGRILRESKGKYNPIEAKERLIQILG